MHQLWSTDAVEARDRLSYWVEAVCNTYVQLDCDTPERERPFNGTIEANQLATLGLSRVTSSPQWVRRTAAKIGRTTEDYFLVSIQTKGCGKIVQDGRIAELSPGDFALYDSTRPYELIFDEPFQQHVLPIAGCHSARPAARHTDADCAQGVRRPRRRSPDDRHDQHARSRHRHA